MDNKKTKDNVALFPASFNPIHNSHINIIKLSSVQYDKLIVYVCDNEEKKYFVSKDKRFLLVKKMIDHLGLNNVEVIMQKDYELTPIFALKNKVENIVRGLRSEEVSVYESILADNYLSYNDKLKFHYFVLENESWISSSIIRKKIENNESIKGYVDDFIESDVLKLWKRGS